MFQRRTSIVRLDRASLAKSVETIEQFSRIEGLDAHGRSARIPSPTEAKPPFYPCQLHD
jgi:histidinol dehydrogenase